MKNSPPAEKSVEHAAILAKRYGRHCVKWRYDPIFYTEEINAETHLENFKSILDKVHPYTDSCFISIIDFYGKLNKNLLAKKDLKTTIYRGDGTLCSSCVDLVMNMADLCKERDVTLVSCCEPQLLKMGIVKANCVDGNLVRLIAREPYADVFRTSTRKGCGCYKSVDIGEYGTCKMGCCYCYAS